MLLHYLVKIKCSIVQQFMDKNGNFSAFLIYFQNVSLTMHFISVLINFRQLLGSSSPYLGLFCNFINTARLYGRNYHSASSTARSVGMHGPSPTTRSTYRTLLLNIVATIFDIDDLLVCHPNIILTFDVYDILDNMHKYLCNWTLNFHKVVQQQISGEVVDRNLVFFFSSSENVTVKKILQWVHIYQSYYKKNLAQFFGPPCRTCWSVVSMFI